MFKKLKIKQGLFTSRLLCRVAALFVLCSLPVSGFAQPVVSIFWDDSLDPTTLSSTFRTFGWGDDYDLYVVTISRERPTQATTLTLYIEEGGVSKRIDETPYDLTDDALPLQRQILIPSIKTSRSSRVFQIRGTVGSGLGGTVRFRYCNDSQTLCTSYLSAAFINDPPTRNINGLYEVFIVNSTTTVVSGANCTAVRERAQQLEITQTGSTASYQYTDDFGQRTMVSAVANANTYVFTAQYSTALPFPGTRTFIMGGFFTDNDNGIGAAYWSYKTNNGDLCKGTYDVQYSRLAEPPQLEDLLVQIRLLLEGLLIVVLNEMIFVSTDTVITHEMIIVPSGTFTMGSPTDESDRDDDEGPQHRVRIQSFAVGKYEVTRGQFAAFVDATGYDASGCFFDDDLSWRNPGFTQTDTHPVTCVSWDDAQAYINWLSVRGGRQYRLLTEAEWEYVARAGTTTAYHFGATISPSQANYNASSIGGTVEVGSYPANVFGLNDVHGNVSEWVEDCWHNNYNGAPSDGSAWTSNCPYEDVRVLRGGSWSEVPGHLRSAYRFGFNAEDRLVDHGFRIARDLTP